MIKVLNWLQVSYCRIKIFLRSLKMAAVVGVAGLVVGAAAGYLRG